MKFSVFYPNLVETARARDVRVTELLREVRSLGITALDTGDADLTPEAEQYIADAGLGVSCIYKFYDFAHSPSLLDSEKALDRAARYGAKFMVNPGFINSDETRGGAARVMFPAMRPLLGMAAERGVTLCMEPFDAANVPNTSVEELLAFFGELPGMKCAFDTGNFAFADCDVLPAYDRLRDYVVHVHCKDRVFDPAKPFGNVVTSLGGRKMCACPVGRGEMPIKTVIDRFVSSGYEGYFAIELFGVEDIWTGLQSSVNYLRGLYGEPRGNK